jgi:hypothetical protein
MTKMGVENLVTCRCSKKLKREGVAGKNWTKRTRNDKAQIELRQLCKNFSAAVSTKLQTQQIKFSPVLHCVSFVIIFNALFSILRTGQRVPAEARRKENTIYIENLIPDPHSACRYMDPDPDVV